MTVSQKGRRGGPRRARQRVSAVLFVCLTIMLPSCREKSASQGPDFAGFRAAAAKVNEVPRASYAAELSEWLMANKPTRSRVHELLGQESRRHPDGTDEYYLGMVVIDGESLMVQYDAKDRVKRVYNMQY